MILDRLRRAKKPPADPQPDPPSEPQAEALSEQQAEAPYEEPVEDVLDVVATLLRTWGEFAIDLGEMDVAAVREQFEEWARHALVMAPAPGSAEGASADGPMRRDWPGLRRFVHDHRKTEQSVVQCSLGDLRDVIWIFLETVGRAVQEDRKTDGRMAGQMDKLKRAVGSGDTQTVKKEALRSITLIESLIETRSQRQISRVKRMASHLDRLNLELVDVKEKLTTDPLTEIPNRAAFEEHLNRLVDVQPVVSVRATLFMIDVDHFKWVNDHYGHSAGDAVLKAVARELHSGLRRRGDFVARFGGDEFVAIVQGADSEGVKKICEQALFSIRDMETPQDGEAIRVSVSIGATSFSQDDDARTWLERSDRALYLAKEAGRDRFVFLDDEKDEAPEPVT